jgi:hypothetical protein
MALKTDDFIYLQRDVSDTQTDLLPGRKRTVNRILQVPVFCEDLISPQIGASHNGKSSAEFGERIVLAASA